MPEYIPPPDINLEEAFLQKLAANALNLLDFMTHALVCGKELSDIENVKSLIMMKAKVTDKQFDDTLKRAVRSAPVKSKLGKIPASGREYIERFIDASGIIFNDDETLSVQVVDKVVFGGEAYDVNQVSPDCPELQSIIHAKRNERYSFEWLRRELRLYAEEHHLGFSNDIISDAVQAWRVRQVTKRIEEIILATMYVPWKSDDHEYAENEVIKMAVNYFNLNSHSKEFVAASIKEFMYQTKRKLFGFPVKNNLMLILFGAQGKGKTTLNERLCAPLGPLSMPCDFILLGDGKTSNIFSKSVLRFEEMNYAERADIDRIKNLITAETTSIRTMRENTAETVRQCAVMLGSSNKPIEILLPDHTGMRRFNQLDFSDSPNWVDVDFLAIWRSVDPNGPSPMDPFRDELAARQATHTDEDQVAIWGDTQGHKLFASRSWVSATMLYDAYKDWQKEYFENRHLNLKQFSMRIAAYAKRSPKWEMTKSPKTGNKNAFRAL